MKTKVYYAMPASDFKFKPAKQIKQHQNCIHVAKVVIKKIHPDGRIETPSCFLPCGFFVNQQDAIAQFKKNIEKRKSQLMEHVSILDSIDINKRYQEEDSNE